MATTGKLVEQLIARANLVCTQEFELRGLLAVFMLLIKICVFPLN